MPQLSDEALLADLAAAMGDPGPLPPGLDEACKAAFTAGQRVLPVDCCAQDALDLVIADGASVVEPVVYTVALPTGMKLLNSNDTFPHWRPRADLIKSIVDAAIVMTRKAKVPKLDRVIIRAVFHPHDRRKRDAHNWSPSVKAAIDGIVRSGVLVDDDSEHVIDGGITLGEPVKGGQLVLLITPVGAP